MPDASQFTLGLFDTTPSAGFQSANADGTSANSALGWTIHTSKAEPELPLPDADRDGEDEQATQGRDIQPLGTNFYLDSDRALARGWPERARDNLAAIRLSKEIEASGRAPTPDEQEQMLRFVGFGATELAQNCFPLPGATTFRDGWEQTGRDLSELASPEEYAALQRATQYAHYTPEPIIRGLWRAAEHLGFDGGRVVEPGMGTGLFFALLPGALRDTCRLTGIEYDPVTARIARFVHPQARVRPSPTGLCGPIGPRPGFI